MQSPQPAPSAPSSLTCGTCSRSVTDTIPDLSNSALKERPTFALNCCAPTVDDRWSHLAEEELAVIRTAYDQLSQRLVDDCPQMCGGNGFPKDTARSIEYYQRAADAGNGRAAATLGVMCLMGEGMEPDPKRAGRWLDEAEELGFDVDDWLDQVGMARPEG